MTVGQADPDLGRLVRVELRGIPLDLYARAHQHSDEVRREFALIDLGQETRENTPPQRLLRLIDELDDRFAAFAAATYTELDDALRRGEATADVVFGIPEAAGQAARTLDRLIDETDDFCRTGDLLTLEAPQEVVAFRKWFLGEFVRQTAGEPPRPWPGTDTD